MSRYRISTEQSELDFDVIYEFIANTYWANNIPKSTLKKAIEHSLCFGVYDPDNQLVGFARLITDRATFAYLADVFVIESHQGKGISKQLIETIVKHPEVVGLRRMVLATRDAHGLYAQYGFTAIDNPEIFMQCTNQIFISDRSLALHKPSRRHPGVFYVLVSPP